MEYHWTGLTVNGDIEEVRWGPEWVSDGILYPQNGPNMGYTTDMVQNGVKTGYETKPIKRLETTLNHRMGFIGLFGPISCIPIHHIPPNGSFRGTQMVHVEMEVHSESSRTSQVPGPGVPKWGPQEDGPKRSIHRESGAFGRMG